MDAIAIDCARRETGGKGTARRHRAEGRLPAVLYGHGIDSPVSVSLDPAELNKGLRNPKGFNAVFSITLPGEEPRHVMIREVQRDAISRDIMHVDLVAPDLNQTLTAMVPVNVTGRSIGVSTGGRLRKPYRDVKLRGKPADIPAEVLIDITNLDHNDGVMASQMPLPEGVEAVYDRDYVVVKVMKPRGKKKEAVDPKAAKKKK